MRGFLIVSGLLGAGIAVAFAVAMMTGAGGGDPLRALPPELAAGQELEGAAAQKALAAWAAGLPRKLPAPVRGRYEGGGRLPEESGAAAEIACSLGYEIADAQRARLDLDFELRRSGQPPLRVAGTLLADGETLWIWGEISGIADLGERRGAFRVRQSVLDDLWRTMQEQLPVLLAETERRLGFAPALPEHPLELVHVAALGRGLAALPAARLTLEGAALRVRAPFSSGEASVLLDGANAMPLEFRARLSGQDPAAEADFLLRSTHYERRVDDAALRPPEGLAATDVTQWAQLTIAGLGPLITALLAGGAPGF